MRMLRLLLAIVFFTTLVFSGEVLVSNPFIFSKALAEEAASGGTVNADAGSVVRDSTNCDYTEIKESLYGTESAGSGGYTAICRQNGAECDGGARGRYQFIRSTRSAYIQKYPECNGAPCDSDAAWISEACWPVQECIMDRYLAESQDRVRNSEACQQLLADQDASKYGCLPTESGLLGAMHLGGNGSDSVCRRILNGTGPSDQLGTSVTAYMCTHGGKAVPGNCVPAPYDPNQVQPIASQLQIDTLIELGYPPEAIYTGSPDGIKENWVTGLMLMAKQFTANMAAQIEAIGMLLDAKHQMETQRLFQEKAAEAHKDYHPSEQMCTFGTFARDLVATSRSADLTKATLSQELLQRDLGSGESMGNNPASDSLSRIARFRKEFCNPRDNGDGLALLCPEAAPEEMQNRDINYTATVDMPLSLKINLTDNEVTNDEKAVFALIDNLFSHNPAPKIPAGVAEQKKFQYYYANLRSLIALRGVARSSIANIIALKTASPNTESGTSSAAHMRALFREFGLQDEEIMKLLGENPSYYAQMELLTKKIYQSPSFYTNLYDKPTNVKRINAAMQAIKLMQDRDIQEALQRREMLLSIMLEIRLRQQADKIYSTTERAMFDAQ